MVTDQIGKYCMQPWRTKPVVTDQIRGYFQTFSSRSIRGGEPDLFSLEFLKPQWTNKGTIRKTWKNIQELREHVEKEKQKHAGKEAHAHA